VHASIETSEATRRLSPGLGGLKEAATDGVPRYPAGRGVEMGRLQLRRPREERGGARLPTRPTLGKRIPAFSAAQSRCALERVRLRTT
jgi:hypothetical protein